MYNIIKMSEQYCLDVVLKGKVTPEEIKKRRALIKTHILKKFKVNPVDLTISKGKGKGKGKYIMPVEAIQKLYNLYDEMFFENTFAKMHKKNFCSIVFCWNNRCTNVAGKVVYVEKNQKKQVLNLSATIFRNLSETIQKTKNKQVIINGSVVSDAFDALQQTMEHELIHALAACHCADFGYSSKAWKDFYSEKVPDKKQELDWNGVFEDKSGHSKLFMKILNNRFNQSNYTHNYLDKFDVIENLIAFSSDDELAAAAEKWKPGQKIIIAFASKKRKEKIEFVEVTFKKLTKRNSRKVPYNITYIDTDGETYTGPAIYKGIYLKPTDKSDSTAVSKQVEKVNKASNDVEAAEKSLREKKKNLEKAMKTKTKTDKKKKDLQKKKKEAEKAVKNIDELLKKLQKKHLDETEKKKAVVAQKKKQVAKAKKDLKKKEKKADDAVKDFDEKIAKLQKKYLEEANKKVAQKQEAEKKKKAAQKQQRRQRQPQQSLDTEQKKAKAAQRRQRQRQPQQSLDAEENSFLRATMHPNVRKFLEGKKGFSPIRAKKTIYTPASPVLDFEEYRELVSPTDDGNNVIIIDDDDVIVLDEE